MSTRCAPPEVQSVHPAVGSAFPSARRPLVGLRFLTASLSAALVSGSLVCHALLRPWLSRARSLQFFQYRHAPAPFRTPLPSAPRISLPSRVLPETTAVRRASLACSSHPHSPSPGVLLPTAVASVKGPVIPGLPRPGTLRLQSSSSLDALLPFAPSHHFWSGRSWDSPSGPCSSRESGCSFELPSPPGSCSHPGSVTLAVRAAGPSHHRGS